MSVHQSYDLKERVSWNWSGVFSPFVSVVYVVLNISNDLRVEKNDISSSAKVVVALWDLYGQSIGYSETEKVFGTDGAARVSIAFIIGRWDS